MTGSVRKWFVKPMAITRALAGALVSLAILFTLFQGLAGALGHFHIDSHIPTASEVPGGLFLAFFISLPLSMVTIGAWAVLSKRVPRGSWSLGAGIVIVGLIQGGILVLVVPTWIAVATISLVGLYWIGILSRDRQR